MRYDQVWALLAERATSQGVIDVETFIRLLAESGVSEEQMLEMLEHDLETDGPIFGKFVRSLSGAASSTAMAAVRQGEAIGTIDGDAELRRLSKLAGVEGSVLEAIQTADPEVAAMAEDAVLLDIPHTWIAELINTCHRCLPLHGSTLTLREWRAKGLLPETIHTGWDSSCHCRLVPEVVLTESRDDLMAPLRRLKLSTSTGLKGSKRTARAVEQRDIDAAIAAREAAMASEEGRRTLRLLGRAIRLLLDDDG